ncbi:MAG: LacI family DNA-binding transcriptional regulator [Allorhizobium sp.]
MKPTVHDIAARAGVSLASVDRVLNRRPGVRASMREKVEAAIETLGYTRDVAAANLAKGRVYPFTFVLPTSDNSFMRDLKAQVDHAIGRASGERTRIRIVEVPAFDVPALAAALDRVLAEMPLGVALVAIDAPEIAARVDRLSQAGIAVVTLVSDLSASRRDHYAGIDNIAAGRTAASLLGRFLRGRSGKVAVLAGSMLVRDHCERLEGFSAVMAEEFAALQLLPVLEGRDDPLVAEAVLSRAFGDHPDIVGVYSLGGGNRGLVRALKARQEVASIAVIAHELTQTTRTALREGVIDAVLNQDAGHEVRSAIRVLKARADGQPVIAAQERIRLDIFLRDNLP